MKTLAIFASGTGSNAIKIIEHLRNKNAEVNFLILSNKTDAPVLQKAALLGIETFVFNKRDLYEQTNVIDFLLAKKTDLIVLAGFLWLVPQNLINLFPQKIINLHPALLPKFGGKGMYGAKVHEAVIAAQEKRSGITIHFIDQYYDQGTVILQAECEVLPTDNAASLAKKIQQLEHEHLPLIVEKNLLQGVSTAP